MLAATASVGAAGFAAVCAWQMGLFVVLGLAWYALLPPAPNWRLPVLVWGRMVRDATGTCLPFSLVGGFLFGARAVTVQGIAWPIAAASTVVDLTTEFLAQIGLVLIGVLILAARSPGNRLLLPVGLGLVAALAAGIAFIVLQRQGGRQMLRLSRRVLGGWGLDAENGLSAIQTALETIYAEPRRVALGTALHLLAWFGTGGASWIAFHLLGARLDFAGALGIEALLHAALATAILVPGYAGVQEAAYAAVGALFGQPPELSLGVSLVRRARDLALGIPILLIWQSSELQARRARG